MHFIFPNGTPIHKTLRGKIVKTVWDGKYRAAKLFYKPKSNKINDDFHNEIKIMRDLRKTPHPHVLHSIADRFEDDYAWIIMPYIGGGEILKHLFNFKRGFSLDTCENAARQLLMALIHIHSLGWIHGDVSLENVLITEQCCLKLCDFGLSQKIGDPRPLGGKRNYKPPEMHRRKKSLDYVRAHESQDTFMLGVCLWSMLFGCMPFDNSS